jgi:hypothetical protein
MLIKVESQLPWVLGSLVLIIFLGILMVKGVNQALISLEFITIILVLMLALKKFD